MNANFNQKGHNKHICERRQALRGNSGSESRPVLKTVQVQPGLQPPAEPKRPENEEAQPEEINSVQRRRKTRVVACRNCGQDHYRKTTCRPFAAQLTPASA